MDNRTPDERFWPRVDKMPGGCWIWQGAKNRGYGTFTVHYKHIYAHRYAYTTLVGPIPEGMVLDHQCHNADTSCMGGECSHRACVNPDHLRVVGQRENLLNSSLTQAHINANATSCSAGHPFDEPNTGRDRKGGRYCRACKRANAAPKEAARNQAKRERYAQLRAAGLSPKDAQSASKRKADIHGL